MYISACGLFSDVWVAWTELILNLSVTICLAPYMGFTGILLGKILSVFFIAFFWKPYFLFARGLHQKVSSYWLGMTPYYLIFIIFTIIAFIIKHYLIVPNVTTFTNLILYGITIFPLFITIYFYIMLMVTRGMKYFIARKPKLYRILIKSWYEKIAQWLYRYYQRICNSISRYWTLHSIWFRKKLSQHRHFLCKPCF